MSMTHMYAARANVNNETTNKRKGEHRWYRYTGYERTISLTTMGTANNLHMQHGMMMLV